MLTDYTAYKYGTPYKGPFGITKFFDNGTVKLQYCATKIRHNIRCTHPYNWDTKVEDFNSINMDDAFNI